MAVCSFTSGFNKSSKEYDSLSNKSMVDDIENMLINGLISYSDYIEFIKGERLNG